ncbi:EamA family transporter RarD [Sulfuritalea sp.]|uniref:EamA family transporter RarD n=1 Tax=Sulfuritalea sp. TaxID=2480090 RepID=UPI001AD1040F|nr:EamA family transporter RarD [Sulfuritalea sp.]MBN8477149.1 EamA family transporter RarD [Sulfuritalea sp.]
MSATHPAATPENTRRGIVAGIGAYLIWGLVPIFFKQIVEVPADEIIAHRVVWAMLLMTAILGTGRGFGDALRVARIPAQLARIALAAALVLGNWLTFVWGVNNGHIIETSLGYFILPLLNVALGVLVLKERLRPLQWLAVLLAAAGVAIEALRAGGLPWIALVLAATFAIYGLLRKQLPLDAASGLFLETVCMTPVALLWLGWIQHSGTGHFGTGANLFDGRDLLLVATGAITAIPLLLFAVAARRLPLSMIAFLQYIAPSIAFLIAVLVYHEPMDFTRTLAFAAIWSGLAVYSVDLLKFTAAKADAPLP